MNTPGPPTNLSAQEYNLEKVFTLRKDNFIRDFVFEDVAAIMKRYHLFDETELHSIRMMENEKERIEKMFFLVIYKNKNVDEFLRVLRLRYDWLANQIEIDLKQLDDDGAIQDDYYYKIRRLRREIPRHIDINVHRCDFLWTIKQKLLSLESNEYLVVHGSFARGKRWVVMDACCNYSVMHQMGGNIFWVNCSKCMTPEAILQNLEKLAILARHDYTITNHKDINNKILMLTESLRTSFEKNRMGDCLIVLEDVQSYETLKAFDLNCKVLVTTRNKKILDKLSNSTIKVELNSGLTREESLELFSKVLNKPVAELPDEAVQLHHICKRNPFVISLIANNLKEYTTNRIIRWRYWIEVMTNHESTYYEEIRTPIEQSLKELPSEYNDLFRSLVIFTDNVNIPIKVLELYWTKKKADVEEIITKFDKLYLLEKKIATDGEIFCCLHYFYYSYLTSYTKPEEKRKMHRTLVEKYRISDALASRTEPDIVDLPDDQYFHFYIGYHLKEAEMKSLFPKLYLDFGFLEQKLRSTGLPNILGDFNLYRDEITGGEPLNITLLEQLTDFLPTVEESIIKSMDTCLLQYAITTEGVIRQEAIKQAEKFPNRVWFNGIDHSYKHRQIVQLPQKPHLIRFVEPNASLIAFSDNSIFLTDMSAHYTVEPTVYSGHNSTIVDIQVFTMDYSPYEVYFISMDSSGVIKIWSLKETAVERRRRSRSDREDIRFGARQNIQAECFGAQNANRGQCIQTIENATSQNLSFLLQKQKATSELRMFVATAKGKIITYYWNVNSNIFDSRNTESFESKLEDIRQLYFVPKYYLMALTGHGANAFFSLKDHAQVPRTRKMELSTAPPINVHQLRPMIRNKATINHPNVLAIVYCNQILHVSLTEIATVISPEIKPLELSEGDQNFVTCSAVTDDHFYLILGTKKGIIVLDPSNGREILRSSVSDNIACIDVCSVDDHYYKYVIISATKKGGPRIYVHGIVLENGCMQWASNKMGSPINENNLNGKEALNSWFSGGQLFDVAEHLSDESFKLVAADSNLNVHQKSSKDLFVQSLSSEQMKSKVTAISVGLKSGFVACETGFVYKNESEQPFMMFKDSIKFLKYYEERDVVVAGTMNHYKIRVRGEDFFPTDTESRRIVESFLYAGRFIILVKEDCSIDIFDAEKKVLSKVQPEYNLVLLNGCDFYHKTLVLGTPSSIVHEYHVQETSDDGITLTHIQEIEANKSQKITSMAITSSDKTILAIGYKGGLIEIYDSSKDKVQLLQKLHSHKEMVYALRFSPWMTAQTIILVSVSEEMCFWNITYILNNPMEEGYIRRSQRFNRRHSKSSAPSPMELTISSTTHTNGNNLLAVTNGHSSTNGHKNGFMNGSSEPKHQLRKTYSSWSMDSTESMSSRGKSSNQNPWIGKCGASDKPELLSCIKFVGSSAEKIYANRKFTKFITIDNEGEIYYLNINYRENM